MSQTNTNTNNGQNRNQISRRGGQERRASNSSGRGDCCNGRGNNSITKYSFKGKMKDGLISKLTITETEHRPSDPLNSRRLVTLFLSYVQIKITKISMRSFITDVTKSKLTSCRIIRTPIGDLPLTRCKLALSIQKPMQNPMGHGQSFLNHGIDSRHRHNHATDQPHRRKSPEGFILEYKRNSRNKSQEYSKFLADKKYVIMILFGQCDEATQTEIALGRKLYRGPRCWKACGLY